MPSSVGKSNQHLHKVCCKICLSVAAQALILIETQWTNIRVRVTAHKLSCSTGLLSPQTIEWILLHNSVEDLVIPADYTYFSTMAFPSTQLSIIILAYRTLFAANFFDNELLCPSLPVAVFNDFLQTTEQIV